MLYIINERRVCEAALRHAMQLQGGLRPEQERAAHGLKTRADNLAQKGKAEEG